MQTKLFSILVTLFIAHSAHAWIFSSCDSQHDNTGNVGCTQSPCNAGGHINWDRGTFSSCTVRVYSDSGCSNQVGIASRDWDHTLTQKIQAFKVSDC